MNIPKRYTKAFFKGYILYLMAVYGKQAKVWQVIQLQKFNKGEK
jgi:hypothetical protein